MSGYLLSASLNKSQQFLFDLLVAGQLPGSFEVTFCNDSPIGHLFPAFGETEVLPGHSPLAWLARHDPPLRRPARVPAGQPPEHLVDSGWGY